MSLYRFTLKYMRTFLLTIFLCSGLILGIAQRGVGQESAEKAEIPAQRKTAEAFNSEYLISPDDLLEIDILDVKELSRAYRVSPAGSISLPLLGKPLPAAGLTLAQLSDRLGNELKSAGLVTYPQVTVSVQQSRLHSVSITGAVKHPQIYAVLGKTTLLDVLSQAEGLTDEASNIAIVRRGVIATHALGLDSLDTTANDREAKLAFTVEIKRIMESPDPDSNVDIFPGDRITVPRAGIIYVVGAVNKPGGFTMKPSKQGMTVLQAIALAENVKPTAISRKAMVLRADAKATDGRTKIPIDLRKVLSGQEHDMPLQADDILFVPDSPSKKAIRKGLETVLQAAAGAAVYRW